MAAARCRPRLDTAASAFAYHGRWTWGEWVRKGCGHQDAGAARAIACALALLASLAWPSAAALAAEPAPGVVEHAANAERVYALILKPLGRAFSTRPVVVIFNAFDRRFVLELGPSPILRDDARIERVTYGGRAMTLGAACGVKFAFDTPTVCWEPGNFPRCKRCIATLHRRRARGEP